MRTRLLLAFCISISVIAQAQLINVRPIIVGQNPLSTKENTPITIKLTDLIVLDADDLFYPQGFSLIVSTGTNYTLQGSTVTPSDNFAGTLTVPVQVNDGQDTSDKFDLKITVINNVVPEITGQDPISFNQGGSFTIQLSHLEVDDPDNDYPEDFTLKVFTGNNYTVSGKTITPTPAFSGALSVPVSVDDGIDESNKFNLSVQVIKPANTPPQITGQDALTTDEDQAITLKLADLNVTDPDDTYPNGFTLKVLAGNNYTVSGSTVSPKQNFSGTLSVPVTVNDGESESAPFNAQITVKAVNDAPVITGQVTLTTNKNKAITIEYLNLTVTDPDDAYPNGFTMNIAPGTNYTASGRTITPALDFSGAIDANVTVNDGAISSPTFKLRITVTNTTPINVEPKITGQQPISTNVNRAVTLQLTYLTVDDPDNNYPEDFTMTVSPGTNYTVSGRVVTPAQDFTGTLTVKVTVNDGTVDSDPFNLQVQVVPAASGTPQITGQVELRINEDETITLQLSHLTVSDDDSNYPVGFTLKILDGKNYTAINAKVIPAPNFNGYLTVVVTVNDGSNTSPPFNLAILVDPINDPPQITALETTPLSYEPGNASVGISNTFDVVDVDNENLNFAEIGIRPEGFHELNDELLFINTINIRGVYDPLAGILSLIGNAPVAEYREAIRSIHYYHNTKDEEGKQIEITPGPRTVYINVSDGQDASLTHERVIIVETVLLSIPNAFTPNGDFVNDTWVIRALTDPEQFQEAIVRVYNKRGRMLYETTGLENPWDGVFNGQVLPSESYYYTIDLFLTYTRKRFKGVVTILR